jgi:hypothetical protein
MITKKTIKAGLKNNLITLENEYAGCIGLCCRIGASAFYFGSPETDLLTAEEYRQAHTLDEIVNEIYEVIHNEKTADENGLDEWEQPYYEEYLKDNLLRKQIWTNYKKV